MKILYLAPDPVPSPKGAAIRIARTVEVLRQLGHEVQLLTPASGDDQRLTGVAHDTVALPQSNFLERMMAFRSAADAWLAGRRAALVQFRGLWEGVAAIRWARRHGVPAVFEAHGFPSIELPYHFPALRGAPNLIEKLIHEEGHLLRDAALVVTPSHTGARYLQMRGVERERIAVIPNCVDATLFSPSPEPPPPTPTLRVVYQGTLAPWQGLEMLLEAMSRMRTQALELHVVGPARSAWRHGLRRLARRCRVHHQLHVSPPALQTDLVPILRTAHVCVAPMPADGRNTVQGCCPIKLLEYMAVARPILATSIAPIQELVEHQRSAWLVAAGSPTALADGLAWMRAHPEERESLGRRARQDALARFPPERFSVETDRALRSLVG